MNAILHIVLINACPAFITGGPRVRGCVCVELVRSGWNDLELQPKYAAQLRQPIKKFISFVSFENITFIYRAFQV